MFTVIASAILWAQRAWHKAQALGLTTETVQALYDHALAMKAAYTEGRAAITSDAGGPMTPAEFAAAFDALAREQLAAGLEAAARIDHRHGPGPDGQP